MDISLCKNPERRVTAVSRTGFSMVRLRPCRMRSAVKVQKVSFSGTTSVQGRDFRVSGTTEGMAEHVSRYCRQLRVAFAVSLAFAALLRLKFGGMDGGGYHLKGNRRTVRPPQ